jgi:hypothetical protein
MRSTFLVFVALIASTMALAQPPPAADSWGPMRVFVGSWSGSRTGANASRKILRTYEPVAGHPQLQILERSNGRFGVWGVISIDAVEQDFVLRHFPSTGLTAVLDLDPKSSSSTRFVFDNTDERADGLRITYDQMSADSFVERVERGRADGPLELVSEARFTRKP